MNSKLKFALLIIATVVLLGALFIVENKDKLFKTSTNAASISDNEAVILAEDFPSEIMTDEELLISKDQDETYVSMAMMLPEVWEMALGINVESVSNNELSSVSNNSVSVNETLGTNATQLLTEAGLSNAIYNIYQLDNNVSDKISLDKFSLNETVYSLPFSISNFPLAKSELINGLYNSSMDYYFTSDAYCLPSFLYSKTAAYVNLQINSATNMVEAICYDYPHYENDESYFTCFIAGIGIGARRKNVEDYFGKGYQLNDSQVVYKNNSGIVVVEYAITLTYTDIDEEGNEIIVEESLDINDNNLKVERVYMFMTVNEGPGNNSSADDIHPTSDASDNDESTQNNEN